MLSFLSLYEFHAINRLPEDFGDLLPDSIDLVTLEGWRNLEELPRFFKVKTTKLLFLNLKRLHSLKRLPEIADWPRSLWITIADCKNLCTVPLPSCAIIEHKFWTLETDSWVLAKDVVEKFGHFRRLLIQFSVKSEEDWEAVKLALSCSPDDVSSPVIPSRRDSDGTVWFDAYETAVAVKALEVLRPLYGRDGDGYGRFGVVALPIWARFIRF